VTERFHEGAEYVRNKVRAPRLYLPPVEMILKPVPFKARAPTTIRPPVRLPAPSILAFLCTDEEKSSEGKERSWKECRD